MDNGYRDGRPDGYMDSPDENEKYDPYEEFEKRERIRREEKLRREEDLRDRQVEPEEEKYDPYQEYEDRIRYQQYGQNPDYDFPYDETDSIPSDSGGEDRIPGPDDEKADPDYTHDGEEALTNNGEKFNPTVIRGGRKDAGTRHLSDKEKKREKKARKRQLKQYKKQEKRAARRRRKLDRKKIDKRKIRNRVVAVLAILFLLTGAAAGLYMFFTSTIFAISEITVNNNAMKSDKELIRESGVKIGQNIFSYKDSEIKKAILKNNPYITDVTITRQLPNRFVITVEEHTPVAAVKYKGQFLILDADGIVSGVEDTQLTATRITGIQVQNYKKGSRPVVQNSSKLKNALKLISKVNDSGLFFKKLDVSSSLIVRGYITDTLECAGEAEDIINNLEGIKAVIYDLSQKNTMSGTITVGSDGYATFSPSRSGSGSEEKSSDKDRDDDD